MRFRGERKAAGEEHQTFASRHGGEISGQAADGEQEGARTEVVLRLKKGRRSGARIPSASVDRIIRRQGRGLKRGGGFLQAFSVGGEVLDDAQGAREIDDGHHPVRAGIGVDEFESGLARARLI